MRGWHAIGGVAAGLLAILASACDSRPPRPPEPSPRDAQAYADIVAAAERERERLAAEWRAAGSAAEAERVEDRARSALVHILSDRILPAWNGTPWSMSGTALAPGRRSIACGYFVSTALEHAGLRVERRRLAQQAAEHVVVSLVPPESIARFRREPLDRFIGRVAKSGDGVYLVGLDRHIGFLIVDGQRIHFHHSSRNVGAVLREPARLSDALATSSYRIVGKLFGRDLVRSWLAEAAIPTQVPVVN
jgi:hypothetical protein